MSLRHYTPHRNRRRGISSRAQKSLYLILTLAILLQALYPLVHGETLRLVTFAVIYVGSLAMLLHAFYSFGWRYAYRYFAITFIFSFLVEEIGVRTGWPFGTYTYGPSLGYQLLGVPIIVPFAWLMMAHPVLLISRRVTQHWVFIYGGATLTAWDLFLDPMMVAAQRWTWTFTGSHVPFEPEIPLSNTVGWLLAGMGLIALLHISLPRERRKQGAEFTAVDIFLSWTLFSGVVGNLFFFNRPGVALFAGSIFALALAPYAFARWLGQP